MSKLWAILANENISSHEMVRIYREKLQSLQEEIRTIQEGIG